ncbi:hypothetical protein C1645_829208 [Glomus cerebriforme]|uniref:Uncharacterized protein n=1 Tax=Glomus cerebriforme TaxID=658196 RepID=A0A397SK30_9GLOM|nr:hypothetical protein C1645_829208 [Glomus cerebriforme]
MTELCDNTKHVTNMMEQHNGITEDLLAFSDKLLKKAENNDALRGYRDWITFRKGKINYPNLKQQYILQLERVLRDVNMPLEEFEILILMKIRSHKDELDNQPEELLLPEAGLEASD